MSVEEVVLIETPLKDIQGLVNQVRQKWSSYQLLSERQKKEFVLRQLNGFKRLMEENREELCQAVKHDLNKNEVEFIMMEFNIVLHDLTIFIRDFDDLWKPRPAAKSMSTMFVDMYVKPEPYGLVLIYGAWNYPFGLTAQPMIGAIAAGNAVILKPSEYSERTSNVLASLIPKYLDKDFYKVITGGVDVAKEVLKERYNYIFYTGSTPVGRSVMQEAAKNLTPVTLELGGKSPVIVADDADLRIAAKRVMCAKVVNSGQTCIAPDYVLLTSPAVQDKFVDHCKVFLKTFFGEDPSKSNDYGRIVNQKHFDRLTGLMAASKGKNVVDEDTDRGTRYIAPAIFVDVKADDALMSEELFGPVLPIVTVNGLDEAIQFVNERERPLAFYVFTSSKSKFDKVSSSTSSGAIVQNNTIIYAGVDSLPFGGVGNSGMGAYHGSYSFDTFSHMKPVYRDGTRTDFLLDVLYPPHSKSKLKKANFFQIPSMRRWSITKPLVLFLLVAVAIALQVYGVPRCLFNLFNFQ